MDQKEYAGAVLIVSSKKEIHDTLRSAFSKKYRRILHAGNLDEARRLISRENICAVIILKPPAGENGIRTVFSMVRRGDISVILHVDADIYAETVFRFRGSPVFVLKNPVSLGVLDQVLSITVTANIQVRMLRRENEKLKKRLADELVVNRAKCLLIEKSGMTEDEAHHYIEREAMNGHMTRAEAAGIIIRSR